MAERLRRAETESRWQTGDRPAGVRRAASPLEEEEEELEEEARGVNRFQRR